MARRAPAGRSSRSSNAPRISASAAPSSAARLASRCWRHRDVDTLEHLESYRTHLAVDQRRSDAGTDAFAQGHGVQHGDAGLADQADQIGIDQRRRILCHGAGDDLAVLQQRQQNRAWRLDGVQQAVGERAAHANRGIIEETDQGGVERRVLVGRTGVRQIGLRGKVRSLPALLAVARLAQGDEVLIRNHYALRATRKQPRGQRLRNGSPCLLRGR